MNNITKGTHGGVDIFVYKDLPAMQVYGVMDAFTKLAETHHFKTILEIGTDYRGLTNALAENAIAKSAVIHTFDINTTRFKNYHPDVIAFHNVDVFKNWGYVDRIIEDAQKIGKVLILCDGGYKKGEFSHLSKKLVKGDCIMVHDYFPNETACKAGYGRWNWWEFDNDHDYVEGLVKTVDYFDNYAWFFGEKV